MQRRELLKTAALGAAACALPHWLRPGAARAATERRRPNIIFVLADDLGLGNVGCCGADHFRTPEIDALAQGGIRFERCYSQPLCGPSRAQIMTGRYAFRTGMTSNSTGAALQPANEIMLPRVLGPAGYATAQVGKWSQLPLHPGDWGFEERLTFEGSGKYWRARKGTAYTINGKGQPLPEGAYLPDVMHDFLVDFIARHRDGPFFVYYSLSHIHGPILPTPDSKPGAGNDALYADNIAYMDNLVGKLVANLDRLKIRENTLLLFVGDNGTARFGVEQATVGGRHLSGQKGSLLEGGSRVPMVVNWPGTAPAGKVNADLVDFSDFLPTFAELAGADLPKGVPLDGHSFAPQIRGQPGAPREWVYVQLNGRWYARSDRWKLDSSGQFFDMKDAPFVEKAVPAGTEDADALAGRKRLEAVLAELNPAAGKQGGPRVPRRRNRPAARRRKRKGDAAEE